MTTITLHRYKIKAKRMMSNKSWVTIGTGEMNAKIVRYNDGTRGFVCHLANGTLECYINTKIGASSVPPIVHQYDKRVVLVILTNEATFRHMTRLYYFRFESETSANVFVDNFNSSIAEASSVVEGVELTINKAHLAPVHPENVATTLEESTNVDGPAVAVDAETSIVNDENKTDTDSDDDASISDDDHKADPDYADDDMPATQQWPESHEMKKPFGNNRYNFF